MAIFTPLLFIPTALLQYLTLILKYHLWNFEAIHRSWFALIAKWEIFDKKSLRAFLKNYFLIKKRTCKWYFKQTFKYFMSLTASSEIVIGLGKPPCTFHIYPNAKLLITNQGRVMWVTSAFINSIRVSTMKWYIYFQRFGCK